MTTLAAPGPADPDAHPVLASFVDVVAPWLDPALVDGPALAEIRTVASRLPGTLSRRIGFEVRLGEEAARADFLVCVTRAEREALASAGEDTLIGRTSWAPLRALAEAWAASPLLDGAVASLWIELDLAAAATAEPVPSVFFGLADLLPERDDPDAWRGVAAHDLATTLAALEVLSGGPVAPGLRRHLAECFGALPPGAKVFQVGAMLSRGTAAVRVCVRRLGPALPAYLAGADWPGDVEAARPTLEALLARAEWVTLDLDVGEDGIRPGLGLECAFDTGVQGEAQWRDFGAHLAVTGLALPAKVDALLRWPAVTEAEGGEEALVRAVAHVKLAWRDGTLRDAKGYFGCWRRPLAWRFLRRRVDR